LRVDTLWIGGSAGKQAGVKEENIMYSLNHFCSTRATLITNILPRSGANYLLKFTDPFDTSVKGRTGEIIGSVRNVECLMTLHFTDDRQRKGVGILDTRATIRPVDGSPDIHMTYAGMCDVQTDVAPDQYDKFMRFLKGENLAEGDELGPIRVREAVLRMSVGDSGNMGCDYLIIGESSLVGNNSRNPLLKVRNDTFEILSAT
jgi:hypothetical protein